MRYKTNNMKTKAFILTFCISMIYAIACHGQQVKIYLKNGSIMQGKLITITKEKTDMDPDGRESYFVANNTEIDSLIYMKSGNRIVYPLTNTSHLKSYSIRDANPPRTRSVFSFGVVGGYTMPIGIMAFVGYSDTKFKPSMTIGGSVVYFLTQLVAFEVMVTYNRANIVENNANMGWLTMVPIIFNYKMQTKPRKKAGVGFNMDIGAGVALTSYKNGPAIHKIEQGTNVDIVVSTNNPFMFNMAVGMDVFFNKQVSLGVDCRLLAGNVKTEWKFNGITQNISEQIYASKLIIGLKLRYWLDH